MLGLSLRSTSHAQPPPPKDDEKLKDLCRYQTASKINASKNSSECKHECDLSIKHPSMEGFWNRVCPGGVRTVRFEFELPSYVCPGGEGGGRVRVRVRGREEQGWAISEEEGGGEFEFEFEVGRNKVGPSRRRKGGSSSSSSVFEGWGGLGGGGSSSSSRSGEFFFFWRGGWGSFPRIRGPWNPILTLVVSSADTSPFYCGLQQVLSHGVAQRLMSELR